MIVSSWQM